MSTKTPEQAAEEVPATFAFREAENNGYERGKREERERVRAKLEGEVLGGWIEVEWDYLKKIIFGGGDGRV